MNVDKTWIIQEYNGIEKDKNYWESIFSLGNGYMGVRGFNEEEKSDSKHKLCTYLAGIFDYYKGNYTDMVNTPNFWKTTVEINGEEFSIDKGRIVKYSKFLNMKEGFIKRNIIWENSKGDKTKIETIKFLSLCNKHNAFLQMKIIPLNYSGKVKVNTGIDADVQNVVIDDDQMKDDIGLFDFLLEERKNTYEDNISIILLRTKNTKYFICEGFSIELFKDNEVMLRNIRNINAHRSISQEIEFHVEENHEYVLNKYICVWTSRENKVEQLERKVIENINKTMNQGFNLILNQHKKAWENKWKISDIIIEGDDRCLQGIRYNIFQLIQTNAEDDPKVSIGARGIMHGRYKGCYFWDTEIFMLPFYLYTNPKASRNLLLYRYYTLPGAEKNAVNQNVDGARYPWMSSIDGTEQCDSWDIGLSEVHITADIAYAINHYYEATDDIEFIINYGLEILIKTARYWKSRFTYNKESNRYNMLFVKGPNEYGGVTINNTYTVIMAVYNINLAIKFIKLLKERYPNSWLTIKNKVGYKDSESEKWEDIIDKVVINYDKEQKLYIEDDNFLKLEPIDLRKIKEDDTPLYRSLCFDRLQRYRVLKQADILLMMFLLPDKFSFEEKLVAWDYYEPITTHDSSLSYGTHAAVAARLGLMDKAYNYFAKSVRLDLDDIMNNTGIEGIHFASLGASWQAIMNGFAGIELNKGIMSVNPHLPKHWNKLKFKLKYKESLINLVIDKHNISIILEDGKKEKLYIYVNGKRVGLNKGEQKTILY